jgi:hypothetical protein
VTSLQKENSPNAALSKMIVLQKYENRSYPAIDVIYNYELHLTQAISSVDRSSHLKNYYFLYTNKHLSL